MVKKCKEVGVDGLIIVDLPWPDNKIFSKQCKKNSITFIQLLSPTTSKDRMKKIIKESKSEEEIIELALNLDKVSENLKDKEIIKKIYIKDKLVNFAVK